MEPFRCEKFEGLIKDDSILFVTCLSPQKPLNPGICIPQNLAMIVINQHFILIPFYIYAGFLFVWLLLHLIQGSARQRSLLPLRFPGIFVPFCRNEYISNLAKLLWGLTLHRYIQKIWRVWCQWCWTLAPVQKFILICTILPLPGAVDPWQQEFDFKQNMSSCAHALRSVFTRSRLLDSIHPVIPLFI